MSKHMSVLIIKKGAESKAHFRWFAMNQAPCNCFRVDSPWHSIVNCFLQVHSWLLGLTHKRGIHPCSQYEHLISRPNLKGQTPGNESSLVEKACPIIRVNSMVSTVIGHTSLFIRVSTFSFHSLRYGFLTVLRLGFTDHQARDWHRDWRLPFLQGFMWTPGTAQTIIKYTSSHYEYCRSVDADHSQSEHSCRSLENVIAGPNDMKPTESPRKQHIGQPQISVVEEERKWNTTVCIPRIDASDQSCRGHPPLLGCCLLRLRIVSFS